MTATYRFTDPQIGWLQFYEKEIADNRGLRLQIDVRHDGTGGRVRLRDLSSGPFPPCQAIRLLQNDEVLERYEAENIIENPMSYVARVEDETMGRLFFEGLKRMCAENADSPKNP